MGSAIDRAVARGRRGWRSARTRRRWNQPARPRRGVPRRSRATVVAAGVRVRPVRRDERKTHGACVLFGRVASLWHDQPSANAAHLRARRAASAHRRVVCPARARTTVVDRVHPSHDRRAAVWRRSDGRRRGRQLRAGRSRGLPGGRQRARARRRVHRRVVFPAAGRAGAVPRRAGASGRQSAPAVGVRERGLGPGTPTGGPVVVCRAGPAVCADAVRRLDAAARAAVCRAGAAAARAVSGPAVQARRKRFLERGPDRRAGGHRRDRQRRLQGLLRGHRPVAGVRAGPLPARRGRASAGVA